MTSEELGRLKQITDMRFQAEQDQFRAICEEERHLRELLKGLDRRKERAREDLASDPSMRMIGKDLAWMNWADQHRRRLTAQLANSLARKEIAFARFQEAYGKDTVLHRLLEKAQESERGQSARQEAERVEDFIALLGP
ncbi:MAG: hypothetical protein GYB25_01300 [Rhodobacteraceae bacterium]|nr:hypothetical protein [Paracoccaceae bacterium]